MDTFADEVLSGLLCQACHASIPGPPAGHPCTCMACVRTQHASRLRHTAARHKRHRQKKRRARKIHKLGG